MSRPRSILPLLLGASLLSACAGAPPAPPIAEATTVVIPTASVAPPIADAGPPEPPTEVAAPAPPPSIALPAPASCEFTTSRWRSPKGTELRFRPGGPVFARIASGQARLHLPVGLASAGGAVVDVADAGLSLRGHVDGAAVALHATAPLVLGEVAIPHAFTPLGWTSSSADHVTVTLGPVEGVEPVQPLSAAAPCDALALDLGSFSPGKGVPGTSKKPQRTVLRVGGKVALSATPGGPPAADLTAKDEDDGEAQLIDTHGKHSRILWDRRQVLLFGWVASADLHAPKAPGSAYGYGSGSGSGFGRSVHPVARAVCHDDVPVVAEAEGERLTVGSIAAGTTIERMDRGAVDVEVWVKTGAVQVSPPARLLVRAALLKGCSPRDL